MLTLSRSRQVLSSTPIPSPVLLHTSKSRHLTAPNQNLLNHGVDIWKWGSSTPNGRVLEATKPRHETPTIFTSLRDRRKLARSQKKQIRMTREIEVQGFKRVIIPKDDPMVPIVFAGPFGNPQAQWQEIGRTSTLLQRSANMHGNLLENDLAILFDDFLQNSSLKGREDLVTTVRTLVNCNNIAKVEHPKIPEERKQLIALCVVVVLKDAHPDRISTGDGLTDPPQRLCRMLPALLHRYNLGHGNYIRTVLTLYYGFLKDGSSEKLPKPFYDTLLARNSGKEREVLLQILPWHTLVQKCPRPSVLEALLKYEHFSTGHWMQRVLKSQKHIANGNIAAAMQILSHVIGTARSNIEYVNALYMLLDEAEKLYTDEETIVWVVTRIANFCQHESLDRLHPYIWIRLIEYARTMKSSRGIIVIVSSLHDKSWVGSQVFRRLILAVKHLGLDPLDPIQFPGLDRCASTSAVLASFILRSWHDFYAKGSDHNKPLHSNRYAQLSPLYSRYYPTKVLNAIGLPSSRTINTQTHHKHRENGAVLSMMITNYLTDHDWDLRTSLTIYRRFRELIHERQDLVTTLNESAISSILASLLSAAAHSDSELLELCMNMATDIVKQTQLRGQPIQPWNVQGQNDDPGMPPSGAAAWAFTSLVVQFSKQGRFDAAERVLEQIRRNHPRSYPFACKLLMQGYSAAKRYDEADDVDHRMSMSGWKSETYTNALEEEVPRFQTIVNTEFKLIGASTSSNIICPLVDAPEEETLEQAGRSGIEDDNELTPVMSLDYQGFNNEKILERALQMQEIKRVRDFAEAPSKLFNQKSGNLLTVSENNDYKLDAVERPTHADWDLVRKITPLENVASRPINVRLPTFFDREPVRLITSSESKSSAPNSVVLPTLFDREPLGTLASSETQDIKRNTVDMPSDFNREPAGAVSSLENQTFRPNDVVMPSHFDREEPIDAARIIRERVQFYSYNEEAVIQQALLDLREVKTHPKEDFAFISDLPEDLEEVGDKLRELKGVYETISLDDSPRKIRIQQYFEELGDKLRELEPVPKPVKKELTSRQRRNQMSSRKYKERRKTKRALESSAKTESPELDPKLEPVSEPAEKYVTGKQRQNRRKSLKQQERRKKKRIALAIAARTGSPELKIQYSGVRQIPKGDEAVQRIRDAMAAESDRMAGLVEALRVKRMREKEEKKEGE